MYGKKKGAGKMSGKKLPAKKKAGGKKVKSSTNFRPQPK